MAKKSAPWSIPEKVVKEKAAETMQLNTPAQETPSISEPTAEVDPEPVKKKVVKVVKKTRKKATPKEKEELRVIRIDDSYHNKLKFLALDDKMKIKSYVENLIAREWKKSRFSD